MNDETYDGILEYLKTNLFPKFILLNDDRNMRFHFKVKCQKYAVANGHLVYLNKSGDGDLPRERFVLRVSEVEPILSIVHDLIGHLGMKRTQAAIFYSFYWRSVRQDVQRFVNNCKFCIRKKVCGKKVLKSIVDVLNRPVLDVRTRPEVFSSVHRFVISLRSDAKSAVTMATTNRSNLTRYTFPIQKSCNLSDDPSTIAALPSTSMNNNATIEQSCRFRSLPYGHSLDGFHEIYCNLHKYYKTPSDSNNGAVVGKWFTELDTCRKHRGGRKRNIVIAEVMVEEGSDNNATVSQRDNADSSISKAPAASTSYDSGNGGELTIDVRRLCDGFTARYVGETTRLKVSKKRASTQNLLEDLAALNNNKNINSTTTTTESMKSCVAYEFSTEYWHLPPTFEA